MIKLTLENNNPAAPELQEIREIIIMKKSIGQILQRENHVKKIIGRDSHGQLDLIREATKIKEQNSLRN